MAKKTVPKSKWKACYLCKQRLPPDEMKKCLTHWLCPKCFDKFIQSDEYFKEKFTDDVWKLYSKDTKPNIIQLKAQIDSLIKNLGFKYQGLCLALDYYLKRNEWNTNYLLYQAFPQAYYEAKAHYIHTQKVKDLLASESYNTKNTHKQIKGKNWHKVPRLQRKEI